MKRLDDPAQLRAFCDAERARGQRIGFVPTMGALHEGHLSLVHLAHEHSDRVVVSVFVNPLQFGRGEDLARYPNAIESDATKCAAAGVAMLFTPVVSDLYGEAFQTHVQPGPLADGLCGERRPGHFRGVCTVVSKLFNIVGPCAAAFGEKDYQQLRVIEQMVQDLDQPVRVLRGPIVREPDGVAMSSRNAYLDADQRRAATCLYRSLQRVAALAKAGPMSAEQAIISAREVIDAESCARLDYLEVRDAGSLAPVEMVRPGSTLVALAVQLDTTRLIDNIVI